MHNYKVGKVKRNKAQAATLNLCNVWSFTTSLNNHPNGRIWLHWKPMTFYVNTILMISQLIHCEVVHRGTNMMFQVTLVYGLNDQALRREL